MSKRPSTIVELKIQKLNPEGQRVFNYFIAQEKKARDQREMSQSDLSMEIGRSRGFVQKMENGVVIPSVLDLLALTLILKKPFKYFIPGDVYFREKDEETSGEEWELIKEFRKLKKDNVRELAIKQIKQLAEIDAEGKK